MILAYTKLTMAEESIFTKIIKGEIPSVKIYEDENTGRLEIKNVNLLLLPRDILHDV